VNHRSSLLRLAVPNYVALLSGVLTGIVDVAWVARLGPSPIAAVAVATGVENALLGIVLLINGGVTVRLAAALGGGDPLGAGAVIRAGWRLYFLITPVVVLAGLTLRHPLAGAFLGDPATAGLAADYFTVLFPGVAIFYAQQVVDANFAGRGDTRTPMRLALIANALILVLDPLLIYGPGPFPALGIAGAALATTLGRAAALLAGLLLLRRSTSPPAGSAGADGPLTRPETAVSTSQARTAGTDGPLTRPETAVSTSQARTAGTDGGLPAPEAAVSASRDWAAGSAGRGWAASAGRGWAASAGRGWAASAGRDYALTAVLRTGGPIAGDFLVRMAGSLALIAFVSRSGIAAVAAYGIGLKVLYFATMAFYAIRNAATIHTPRTLSTHPEQRPAIGRQALTLALLTGGVASVLFAPLIMRVFTADPEVSAIGTFFLRCVGGYLVPIAAVIALGGFLMAAGRGPRLFVVTVTGTVTQTALAWWLPTHLDLPGVWLAMAMSALLQLLLVILLADLSRSPLRIRSRPCGVDRRARVRP
jgi:Na+-driven multidrug efflux pump